MAYQPLGGKEVISGWKLIVSLNLKSRRRLGGDLSLIVSVRSSKPLTLLLTPSVLCPKRTHTVQLSSLCSTHYFMYKDHSFLLIPHYHSLGPYHGVSPLLLYAPTYHGVSTLSLYSVICPLPGVSTLCYMPPTME